MYAITTDHFDSEKCVSFLQHSLKKKATTVIESIEGYQMTKAQKERMIMVRSHLQFVEQSLNELDARLDNMVTPYENTISLLHTIPGVDRKSEITIISDIGTDMSQFTSSKHL